MSFVLDTSCALAMVLPDEVDDYAPAALEALVSKGAIVPELFWTESANALLVVERRGRHTAEDADMRMSELLDLNLQTRAAPRGGAVLQMARRYNLSAYDALYAVLAQQEAIPLATLDKKLIAASEAGAFTLWQPPEQTTAEEGASGDG